MDLENTADQSPSGYRWAAAPVTIVLVVLLLGIVATRRPEWLFPLGLTVVEAPEAPCFVTFHASSPQELSRIVDVAWSVAGGSHDVPNLAPSTLPDEMHRLEVDAKKRTFFRSLAPHVLRANQRIREERSEVRELWEAHLGDAWEPAHQHRLESLARRYRLERGEGGRALTPAAVLGELRRRVDVIPPSLALAQAAIESAWGASRFARLGNNLFGQWVFSSRGIVPLDRPEGERYTLARFRHLGASVEAYMRNLNTLWAYEEFRKLRGAMRAAGQPLDSRALAKGLTMYSTRRSAYVRDVRQMIDQNRLGRFDGRRLADICDTVWEEVLQKLQGAKARVPPSPGSPDV